MVYDEVGAWSGRAHQRGAGVVGYNGRKYSRPALAWGCEEAAQRDAPLLVLFAANYPGMTVEPGPGLLRRDPGTLEAAEEVTARGVSEALEVHPGLWIAGATEVTSPSQALIEASTDAALVVLGSRGYGRVVGALLGSVAFERIAAAAAARLREVHPELTVTTRVEDCPAELTLVDASADAGLVVVGTRGRGAFHGMLLGSVSHAVIHGAGCAVAVVGEGQG